MVEPVIVPIPQRLGHELECGLEERENISTGNERNHGTHHARQNKGFALSIECIPA